MRQIVTVQVDAARGVTGLASNPTLRIGREIPGSAGEQQLPTVNAGPAGHICSAGLPVGWHGQVTRMTPSAMPMSKGSAAVSSARRSLPR